MSRKFHINKCPTIKRYIATVILRYVRGYEQKIFSTDGLPHSTNKEIVCQITQKKVISYVLSYRT